MSWHNVAGQLTDQQVREQLLAALCQPFEEPGENQITSWFEVLERSIPMWSFQPLAFRQINDIESPSTSPLAEIIDSILADEEGESDGDSLISALSRRRYNLTNGIVAIETWGLTNSRKSGVIVASDSGRYWSPDLRSTIGFFNPQYSGIGKRVTDLIDTVTAARGKDERATAKRELDDYLKELAKSRRGRPTEGPPLPMLKALYEEGRLLLDLLWDLPEVDLDARSAGILESELSATGSSADLSLWSRRLVLPLLSRAELLALSSEAESAHTWRRARFTSWKPASRYFTIWVLAHRLDLNPVTLAEKVRGSRDAEYFSYKDNPINAFSTA